MERLSRLARIREIDGLPPGLRIVAALRDEDGAPGVALVIGREPVLAMSLGEALLLRDWLTEEIDAAQKLAVECGESVRRASRARRN